jgi:hypothetical protein
MFYATVRLHPENKSEKPGHETNLGTYDKPGFPAVLRMSA